MIVLGLSEGSGAGAAVVRDGQLVAVVPQEQVDRVPGSRAFPSAAIDAALDAAGVRAREVHRVAVAGTLDLPDSGLRAELRARAYGVHALLRGSGLWRLRDDARRLRLGDAIRELGFERASVETVEHDRAHASAVYRTQPRASALVVTLDASGDGAAVTVSAGRHLQLDRLYLQTSLASIAEVPTYVAEVLGRTPAQVAAMAGRGAPSPALVATFASLVRAENEGFNRWVGGRDALARTLRAENPADVAAAVEDAVASAVSSFLQRWIARTGLRDVVLGGSLAEDSRLVGALAKTPGLATIWTGPLAGDAGLAAGAALHVAGTACAPLATAALGPAWSDTDMYRQLSVAGLPREGVDDPDEVVAALVDEGQVVARVTDTAEVGPRAHGTRAVLFRADDASVVQRARQATGRDPSLPVGFAVRAARAAEVVALPPGLDAVARFGGAALTLHADARARWPAVVNPDGTCLPVVVHPGDVLDGVLAAWERVSGQCVIGLASFHLAGQPIVHSPNDAARAWRDGRTDAMVMGRYLVRR